MNGLAGAFFSHCGAQVVVFCLSVGLICASLRLKAGREEVASNDSVLDQIVCRNELLCEHVSCCLRVLKQPVCAHSVTLRAYHSIEIHGIVFSLKGRNIL